MGTAVLCVAVAALLWPDRRAARVRRPAGRRPVGEPGRWRPWVAPTLAAAAAVGAAAALSTPLVAVLAGTGAVLGVRAGRARRHRRDDDRELAALVEALGTLAAELRGGRTVHEAVGAAVDGCDPAAGRALALAVRAPGARSPVAGSGTPVQTALDRLAAAVQLSERTGCSLAAVVGAVEDDLRARRRQAAELRSALAGPQASALLLAALPLLGLAMGNGIGADPWRVLTTTGTGQVLLVAGVLLEAAGVAWTRRLVRAAVP